MKLDCVLTAVNENKLYIQFVPYFIKVWNKIYPDIDIKVILIANSIPEILNEYINNIILFEPIENVSTSFISQYIRLLYPAILNYENGIMITDIDIVPMNNIYYTENISNYDNNKFIYLRNFVYCNREYAMCYNTATNKVWGEIFNIKTKQDIINRLNNVYKNNEYVDGHGNTGWSLDQLHLYSYINYWKNKYNFIMLNDNETGIKRLDRDTFDITDNNIINDIKNRKFSDYHCYRPYLKFKNINDKILEIL
jgi:hypothetical protein